MGRDDVNPCQLDTIACEKVRSYNGVFEIVHNLQISQIFKLEILLEILIERASILVALSPTITVNSRP
jgi:hypothetical protein